MRLRPYPKLELRNNGRRVLSYRLSRKWSLRRSNRLVGLTLFGKRIHTCSAVALPWNRKRKRIR